MPRDSESMRFFRADIRDERAVARFMQNIALVFHLAAQASIMRALQNIDYLSSTNIVGTATVLRVARVASVRRVVFTSSRKVYGELTDLPAPETAPLRPKKAYGIPSAPIALSLAPKAGSPLVILSATERS